MNKKNIFIERSLKNALDFFIEAVFSEEVARSGGLLQSIAPKVKIALLCALLLVTIYAKTIASLAALYLLSMTLAVLSRIRIMYYLKRVWFFIPIFTLFIAIPAIFTHGLSTAVLFVLRVGTCVSFVVLVTITTKHKELIRSLRSLGIPVIFVSTLDMMYRYVYMFIRIFEEMHLGLKGRLVRNLKAGLARYWIASRMTFMFKRSLKMSEDVYMAMVARGYLNDGK